MTTPPLHVLALCGSLRPQGHTQQALTIALEGAQEVGATTTLLHLADYHLPFCEAADATDDHPGVQQLRAAVQGACGIVLGTPEYHGSFSGVLKNALDLLGFDEFEGKMLGLVGVSGGQMGALMALNSLRVVGRALHAWVVPEQVGIAHARQAFAPDGRLRDKRLEEAVKNVGRQVARFAYLHSSEQAREFLRLWETAPANPGGQGHAALEG